MRNNYFYSPESYEYGYDEGFQQGRGSVGSSRGFGTIGMILMMGGYLLIFAGRIAIALFKAVFLLLRFMVSLLLGRIHQNG